MNDAVEIGERCVVTDDFGAQGGAIQLTFAQHIRAEASSDCGEHGAAGRLGFARENVCIDHRRAPLLEEVDDRRLPCSDVSSETDVKH